MLSDKLDSKHLQQRDFSNAFSFWPSTIVADFTGRYSVNGRGWTNLMVADHWVRQTGFVTRALLFQLPSTREWKVGGNREQTCLSHLSAAAAEVFLSKVLKPNCFSAQRPSVESYTVTEPWSLSMPALQLCECRTLCVCVGGEWGGLFAYSANVP